jgi:soluble lytic murein transglycosylase
MRFFKFTAFFLVCGIHLIASDITLQQIDEKPTSRAKDFMIWEYFHQNITPQEAQKAFYQIRNVDRKLFRAYAKVSELPDYQYAAKCMHLSKEQLLQTKDVGCIQLSLTPASATYFTKSQRLTLSQKIEDTDTKEYLSLMALKNITPQSIQPYSAATILTVLNNTKQKFLEENFNHTYNKVFLKKLMASYKFNYFIKRVTTDYKLDKLQRSLLTIDGSKLNAQSNFYLALNALRHEQKKQTLFYLDTAYNKSKKSEMRDKILFWKYLVTKEKKYLQRISLDPNINFYTLYAKNFLNIKIENYFTKVIYPPLNTKKENDNNISDPFVWLKIRKQIAQTPHKKLLHFAYKFNDKSLAPVKAFIVAKAYNYKMHNFIMPYNRYLHGIDLNQKAFFYAIMRQESRFIPSALSTSYALGLMQLMPFVADALSKQLHYDLTSYSQLFSPKTNILFARKYMKWLNKNLDNPLFKAYAYNGGYGFLQRYLKKERFLDKKYEPFLSMELMKNSQTREYGKKVLTNYIMYQNILGKKTSIVNFLSKLKRTNGQ